MSQNNLIYNTEKYTYININMSDFTYTYISLYIYLYIAQLDRKYNNSNVFCRLIVFYIDHKLFLYPFTSAPNIFYLDINEQSNYCYFEINFEKLLVKSYWLYAYIIWLAGGHDNT